MNETGEPAEDYFCPRCGQTQVVIEHLGPRLRLACTTCEYEVTRQTEHGVIPDRD